jgi:hypothetical protein
VRELIAEMRRAFPRRLYRRRALVESLFSSVKSKLSARAPGRSLRMQMRQALLLGLSFNLYRLNHRCLFLRMSTEPPHAQVVSRKGSEGFQQRLSTIPETAFDLGILRLETQFF